MNKPALLISFVFATFCTCANSHEDYQIHINFGSKYDLNPYNVSTLVNVHNYCMDKVNTADKVDGSKTNVFWVETNDYIFSTCAFHHSSATYTILNFQGKQLGELEFYKPVDDSPYLIFTSSIMKCDIIGLSVVACYK